MSCGVIREALVSCLLKSDCVLRSDPPKSASDCIKSVDELPEECVHLRKAFFECKRGMVSFLIISTGSRSIANFFFLPDS